MKHRATKRFWSLYSKLNNKTQELSDKAFDLLEMNQAHPSLQFKKVGKLYSARIDIVHRALAVKDNEGFIWVWLGHHDEYDKILKQNQ
ncbi:hypothetical protein HOB87_12730 [Candidatus Woesearchaeota archaeon]|jgi:hypothetical protein|nr:hypothetical protein [Candidatus Woesearchaeota archaeon]MBT7556157.1 hypothetical protein [Candidatus Woesearchaeota archaeon]